MFHFLFFSDKRSNKLLMIFIIYEITYVLITVIILLYIHMCMYVYHIYKALFIYRISCEVFNEHFSRVRQVIKNKKRIYKIIGFFIFITKINII